MSLILSIALFLASLGDSNYYTYVVGKSQDIKLYWKDERGDLYRRLDKIPNVSFATNGGMFMEDLTPCGLFIQEGKVIKPINHAVGKSNFCLKPNGIFYVSNDRGNGVCKTEDFKSDNVKFATQSGPMLVVDGKISPAVINLTKSKYPRNGVGILPSGEVLFAMSKKDVSLYEFGLFFQKSGCTNALHLDGAISQMLPFSTNWKQNFGVIIAVPKNKNK